MKKTIPFQNKEASSYQMDAYCIFCKKITEEMIHHSYKGIGLDNKEFYIPVHLNCYQKKIRGNWIYFFITFSFTFLSILFLESLLFSLNFSAGIIIINLFLSLIIATFVGLKIFINRELQIANYKRTHTDYEDYYKLDRLKWKR